MTNFSKLIRCIVISAAALYACAAQATTVSGTFNSQGYSIYNFTMANGGTVDFQAIDAGPNGALDPTFSLFNGAGQLIITIDDNYINQTLVLMPRLTQTLAAGNYSLLVDTCCSSWFAAIQGGAVAVGTDGTSQGDYFVGGNSTLASTTAHLDGLESPAHAGKDWLIEITGDVSGRAAVPEPASVLLFGLAFAGMLAGRSRIARR
jgi:hypothetical protein